MADRGPDRISPFFIPMGIANVGAGQIAIASGALGPNFATVSACATGGHALGEAWETIRRGDADVMIAGGVEAGIHEATVGGFASMKALSTRNDDPAAASRPFDKGRDGFVMGEGCGVLILEALEHAEARGATPLAELVGYGATADASHITLPAPGGIGAVRAARIALDKAGMEPSEIGHVNAHATSTAEGDKAELQSIRTIFGDHAPERRRDRQQVDARPHAGRRGRDRGDRHDPRDPRGLHPADAQLRGPRRRGRRPRHRRRRPGPPRPHGGDVQLVRVRRPEHGARVPQSRRMTADDGAQQTNGEDLGMTEPGLIDGETREAAIPVAVGPGPADPPELQDPGDASLLALVDRLTTLLEASDLAELEVASGATTIILRSPAAVAGVAAAPGPVAAEPAPAADAASPAPAGATAVAAAERPSVKAPLTGIYYGSPSPGATPYVAVGHHVAVGQIIGLIEAMKLFNEIKSDLAGRVVRVCAESGALVKAKQPLIEVEPA